MANNMILEKLEGVKTRFIEVGDLLTQPEILSDMKRYVKLNKEYKELLPIVESYERYKLTLNNISSTKELLGTEKDEEMREMAKAELDELTSKIPEMEEEIKMLIIPADPEVFSPAIFSECTVNSLNRKDGRSMSPICLKALPEVIRKLF
jgi:peptide chain release factor 1